MSYSGMPASAAPASAPPPGLLPLPAYAAPHPSSLPASPPVSGGPGAPPVPGVPGKEPPAKRPRRMAPPSSLQPPPSLSEPTLAIGPGPPAMQEHPASATPPSTSTWPGPMQGQAMPGHQMGSEYLSLPASARGFRLQSGAGFAPAVPASSPPNTMVSTRSSYQFLDDRAPSLRGGGRPGAEPQLPSNGGGMSYRTLQDPYGAVYSMQDYGGGAMGSSLALVEPPAYHSTDPYAAHNPAGGSVPPSQQGPSQVPQAGPVYVHNGLPAPSEAPDGPTADGRYDASSYDRSSWDSQMFTKYTGSDSRAWEGYHVYRPTSLPTIMSARDMANPYGPGPGGVFESHPRVRPKIAPILVDGKKRHPCGWAGCNLTFSTTGHAGRHWRTTHGAMKRFRCLFRNCNSRFTRQDNSLAHYREKHVEVARQRIEDLLESRTAAAIARAAAEGRDVSLSPLTEAPSARDAPALAQAADDFRSGFIKLNGKKAIAVLDEELLMTRGIERVVRTIGQPYRRAPPILIHGLPAPGTDEEAIDPEVAAQAAEDEEARENELAAANGGQSSMINGVGMDDPLLLAPSPTWSSNHPIPPIPPLRPKLEPDARIDPDGRRGRLV